MSYDPNQKRGHHSNAGRWSTYEHSAPEASLGGPARPYLDHAPAEVDTLLAAVFNDIDSAAQKVQLAERDVANAESAKRRADGGSPGYRWATQEYVDEAQARLDKAVDVLEAEREKTAPFDAEFEARGGWTRAFLVRGPGGHVHSSMNCSTCFPTTRFAWLPEYSGRDEHQIVGDAGEAACTVCYPSAPVDVLGRPSKIEDPDVKAAREKRTAEKAVRDAEKARKGISNPDGTELREQPRYDGAYRQVVKTERSAEILAVKNAADILRNPNRPLSLDESPYTDQHPDWAHRGWQEMVDMVEALAHKRGQTTDKVLETVRAKAIAKNKRDGHR